MKHKTQIGMCDECHKRFEYALVHSGPANTSYAYCDRCGRAALLDLAESRFPVDLLKQSAYKIIASGMDSHLMPCECGGKFTAKAAPRCPHCDMPLSAAKARDYIERQAPSNSPDWRWQGNWTGNYCMVVEGKQVRNNFK